MALDRRTVLAAIAAETSDRAGPMPVWLVEVAANARTRPQRDFVAAELIALRQAQLIECHRQNGASGVSLTEAGRAELRALNQGKARRDPPTAEGLHGVLKQKVEAPQPTASDTVAPAAFSVAPGATTPPMPDALGERQMKAPPPDSGPLPDLETVDPELQPRLYSLVMALAKVAMADLSDAIETRDLARARERQRLLDRVHRHLGRPS